MGLCECYAGNGYEMNSDYNPISKKSVWGKPFTGLSAEQQLAFHCIYAVLAEYITTRLKKVIVSE